MTEDPSIFSRVAEWSLGLDRIRLGRDAPLYLKWNAPYPGWLILTILAAVLVCVIFAYRYEPGHWRRRLLLTGIRAALVSLVIAVLCRPVLVLQRNRVSPSHVSMLVDTSASMDRHDRYPDRELAGAVRRGANLSDADDLSQFSRLDLLRRALTADDDNALRALLRRNRLRVARFAGEVRSLGEAAHSGDLDIVTEALSGLAADGTATDLSRALQQTLRPAGGGRLAAIVLATDGRSTVPAALSTVVSEAKAQQVPIYPLLVGSPAPPRDVGITSVTRDGNVFARDILAVRARLGARGLPEPVAVTAQLVDADRDRIVDAASVVLGGEVTSAEVELRTRPDRGGRARYLVRIVPIDDDADPDNDRQVTEVRIYDRPARVLYVEHLPRFEYRYLKNALIREETIRAGVLLLGADPEFAQEGTEPVRRFPETEEELAAYDVLLFGDVDPAGDWLTPAQQRMVVDFVGERGGGLGMIAGERYAPHRWRNTPLEKLVAVRIEPEAAGGNTETVTEPFSQRLTPTGRRSRLFRLFDTESDGPQAAVSALPAWYWYAPTLGPRPATEVLLEHPSARAAGGAAPLVVVGRYGAGKILFHASDDTWRWRRGSGELIYDGYWVQVVRALMPDRTGGASRRVVVRPNKHRYRFGERVEIQVRINDSELLAGLEDRIPLTVLDADARPAARLEANRLSAASAVFEGAFVPEEPGSYSFSVEGAALWADGSADDPTMGTIRVEGATLESLHPEADHDTLQYLAAATGGAVVPLARAVQVLGEIRGRNMLIPDDVSETLWDSRLTFILFAVLITTEWIIRKVSGMI